MDKFAKEFQETLMNSLKDELKNVQTNEEAEKIIKKYEKIDVCAMYQDAIASNERLHCARRYIIF